jgi:7-cyano-7-deazaguanine synthase in queuosine biosynthesis
MSDRLSSVAMVSGGLDSLVSLAEAVRVRDVRLVLFFDYGQRARDGERVSARSAADF